MVVLKPLKVVIKNIEEHTVMNLRAKYWPDASDVDDESHYEASMKILIPKIIMVLPWERLMLRYAFPIKCVDVLYAADETTVVEVHAEYDPTKSTKPKGVIHWVAEPSIGTAPLKVEVRLFDTLFLSENPGEVEDWLTDLNPSSKTTVAAAFAVPVLRHSSLGDQFQFERLGYFCLDPDTTPDKLVFNRTVTLRDSYTKAAGK
ncbi:hypothetical protein GOP47_0013344 [Adiantum capillus-veneris]|uniref:Glutaminyl-tRNA synthetase n=1 Tax=Adiantum capillus-veneris TaxID=13818 RepID=A0A9D4ZD35_ADICA|nr:hypothetical protein GOP47_0013344 [Adiantum capillus-veneris]